MAKFAMVIHPDGDSEAVYDDRIRIEGADPPKRASHVEPIQSGPFAGFWYTDMSPLGDGYRYSLWPPQESREKALQLEHDHVVEAFLLRDVR